MPNIYSNDFINSLKVMHKLEGITEEQIENMPLYKKLSDFLSTFEDEKEE